MRDAGGVVFAVSLALMSAGCGSPHLRAGRRYLAEGNLPLAVVVLDAGVEAEPGNAELRDELVIAQQTYQHQLQQEAERLAASGQPILAVGRTLQLEQLARRGTAHRLPALDGAELEARRFKWVDQAADTLLKDLDRRAGRGRALANDLIACQQVAALRSDESVQRTCERLEADLKLVASMAVAPGSLPGADTLARELATTLNRQNLMFLETVAAEDGRRNATLRLYVGQPYIDETDYTRVEHDVFHTWVPVKDKKGRPVTETVTVQPTQAEIDTAKRLKKPAPQPRQIKKPVFRQVQGEYHHFRATRVARVPFALALVDETTHVVRVAVAGSVESSAESRYHEYQGDAAARKHQTSPLGRRAAPPLPTADSMVRQVLADVPQRAAQRIVERIKDSM